MSDLAIRSTGLIRPDEIGVQVRLREGFAIDADGNLMLDPAMFDWIVIRVVPKFYCRHLETVCGDCGESWDEDWMFNESSTDQELVGWMLQRDI